MCSSAGASSSSRHSVRFIISPSLLTLPNGLARRERFAFTSSASRLST